MRSRRWLVVLLFPLAACGTEAASGSAPAPGDELADRAAEIGVAPEMIYAVTLDGFEPAWQSVGVYGESGYNAAYVSDDGGIAMLTVDPRGATGAVGYRTSGDQHEYVAVQDGVAITLNAGVDAVEADALEEAVAGVHPPSAEELEQLFPDERGDSGGEPVERGDLPAEGDGAPLNPDGTGQEG